MTPSFAYTIAFSAFLFGACKDAKFKDSTNKVKSTAITGNQLGSPDDKDSTVDPTPAPEILDPTPTPTITDTATPTPTGTVVVASPTPLPPNVIVGIRPIPGNSSLCHADGSIQQRINLLTGQIEDLTYYSVGKHDATECQDASYIITRLRLLKKDGSTFDHVNTTMKHWPLSCNTGRPDRQYQTSPKIGGTWGNATGVTNFNASGLRSGLTVTTEWPWVIIRCSAGDSTDFKYNLSFDLTVP